MESYYLVLVRCEFTVERLFGGGNGAVVRSKDLIP